MTTINAPLHPWDLDNSQLEIADRSADASRAIETRTCKIMVVDDVPLNTKVVCAHLGGSGYTKFVQVDDSVEAIATVYREDPDIILLDLMMPVVSGLEILRAIRADSHYAHMPILILTATEDSVLKKEALEAGATDFLSKPIDVDELIPRVHNALTVKIYHDTLKEKVRERTLELEESRLEVVRCLARAAEYRDNDTGQHVIRVGKYAAVVARQMGMCEEDVRLLEQAATLHDVGKIGINDSVLLKPGKLTEQEFELMKEHSIYGYDICGSQTNVKSNAPASHSALGAFVLRDAVSPLLQLASSVALTHHEKWDGSGYPRGLAGEDIPIEGRITAIADVFDALNSKRPYKPAFPLGKCFSIIEDGRGSHFDPAVVNAFFSKTDQIIQIGEAYGDPVD